MAWNTPQTWTADQIVDETDFNQDIRDNLNALAQHDHSGGSGSGTKTLGGTVGLTTVTFADAAVPAAPTGTLTTVFTTGSTVGIRSSGGTARILADTSHEHGITQAQAITEMPTGATAKVMSSFGTHYLWLAEVVSQASASLQTGTVSTAIAIGGSGRRSIAITGGYCILTGIGGGASATFALRLFRDGATVSTSTLSWATGAGGSGVARIIAIGTIDPTLASGTYAYAMTVQRVDSTQGYGIPGVFISAREVSVP